jgi:hypothetical protein
MTTDERIVKYIENELSPQERHAFEVDLSNSVELREEFEKYLKVNAVTDEIKKLKLDPLYLDSILPEFRDKLDAPKIFSVKRNLGYAFGAMLVFILSIVVLKNFFNNESEFMDLQEFTQSLNENQRIELLKNLNGDQGVYEIISDSLYKPELISLFETNLKVNNEVAETYDIEYHEIISGLSKDEVEFIYNEILNSDLLKEDAL